MNKVEYNQTEGFPLDVNILDFGQKANQISQQLGGIIAPLAIVNGCIENGNNISDGLVYIDGELLPFKGGLKQSSVRIVEQPEARIFENGTSKDVLITRYATFGIASGTSYNWSNFHRSISIKEIEKRLIHIGFIQDFYGDVSKIPAGWFLCNGENGTPDLRGMFIVGYDPANADYKTMGNTGGAKDVTLTTSQLPRHKFSGTTAQNGNHNHNMFANSTDKTTDVDLPQHVVNKGRKESSSNYQFVVQQNNKGLEPTVGRTSETGNHSHSFETSEIGENQAHENRPPFYVLAKIMYKG